MFLAASFFSATCKTFIVELSRLKGARREMITDFIPAGCDSNQSQLHLIQDADINTGFQSCFNCVSKSAVEVTEFQSQIFSFFE